MCNCKTPNNKEQNSLHHLNELSNYRYNLRATRQQRIGYTLHVCVCILITMCDSVYTCVCVVCVTLCVCVCVCVFGRWGEIWGGCPGDERMSGQELKSESE